PQPAQSPARTPPSTNPTVSDVRDVIIQSPLHSCRHVPTTRLSQSSSLAGQPRVESRKELLYSSLPFRVQHPHGCFDRMSVQPDTQAPAMNDSSHAPPTRRILMIDDDAELCRLMHDYLRAEGIDLEIVHDAAAGIARARAGGHSLVVLDVMLPDSSGLEVLRSIRLHGAVPVLMLTARGDEVDRI